MTPPDLDRTNALFLDLDGTLLEIAPTPELVVVPPGLPDLLTNVHGHLGGAVAIVTGRPIGVIDSLLAPFYASAAGEHGVALRYQDGTIEEMPKGLAVPDTWRDALKAAAERWPGVLIGSYPSFDADGPQVELVVKSSDADELREASEWLEAAVQRSTNNAADGR